MPDNRFAILRFAKVKTIAQLRAHGAHVSRTRPTPNADPRGHRVVLAGSGDHAADAQAALAGLPRKPRKNATLAIEALLTASPDWLRAGGPPGTFDPTRTAALAETAKRFLAEQFPGCPVSATLHLDESTPHIHATITPIDTTPSERGKRGGKPRLNASRWLDGPERLSALQDAWAAACEPLGLERGVRGSPAKHESVRRLYGRLEADAQAAATDREYAQALRIGMQAVADGRIINAYTNPNGRGVLTLAACKPGEAKALHTAVKPAYADVWRFANQFFAALRDRAAQTVAEATGEVMALLDRARGLKPVLDQATKNQAIRLAADQARQSRASVAAMQTPAKPSDEPRAR